MAVPVYGFRTMMKFLLLFSAALFPQLGYTQGLPPGFEDWNQIILRLVQLMPRDGGYEVSDVSTNNLRAACHAEEGKLFIEPNLANPSYCSGATYLIFAEAVQICISEMSPSMAQALAVEAQRDGVGVWGRWNANGPGTAVLFNELGIGSNFASFDDARPGDFMKIFWNKNVGKNEHGHSSIYLGKKTENGIEMVYFWSSNKPGGFGSKAVPKSQISYALFSRLEHPEILEQALAKLPGHNSYLTGLLNKDSSITEACNAAGIKNLPLGLMSGENRPLAK